MDPVPTDAESIDAQASVLMERGISVMSEDRPGAASEALACFDQALQLREGLPLDQSPPLRYGLAACWLNRAEALMRLGGGAQVAEAIRSCEQAIAQLRTLPLAGDPRYPRRLAMAHHNRGLFLQIHGGQPGEVLAAFEEAIRVVADMEADDLAAAEIGLMARHALCRTFAARLPSMPDESQAMPDDVHEATDAVDDGLALIRRWEQKGETRFRMVACDLLSFGGRVYLIYQPQFLQEFLDENLDPASSSRDYAEDPGIRAAAQDIVDLHARLHG